MILNVDIYMTMNVTIIMVRMSELECYESRSNNATHVAVLMLRMSRTTTNVAVHNPTNIAVIMLRMSQFIMLRMSQFMMPRMSQL